MVNTVLETVQPVGKDCILINCSRKIKDSVHKYLCDTYSTVIPLNNSSINIKEFNESDFAEIVNLDKAA